jgi:Rrf2 family protein
MISITSEYAVRALVALAEGSGTTMQSRELARITNVPSSYLSKILSRLRKSGMLGGTRGVRGGYFLTRAPEDIRLSDVVELFELARTKGACLLGRSALCTDDQPCGAHQEWTRVCRIYEEFLESKTIADLVGDVPRGERG